ncbi:hypothetical protein [Collinsella aerofaciens]|uniref:hypothetical protein n=1 Tax=Collinsella aerofaciens TaxID=74426 RepID=UPI0034A16EFF
MFAAESHTGRHHIAIAAMACLCVLLGGPTCAAGAESLFIAGATYCEPGVSGPGWAWTDAGHLELDGYAGDATAADGDLVVTLAGQNSVTESNAPDADITQCGMEVWGDLTLRGTGSLAASGSQCAIHVSRALVVDGCAVDARADGADVTDEAVAARASTATWPCAAAGASSPREPGPERACAPTACICRIWALVLARLAAGFPSLPRGSMRPVPTAALRARAGRLFPRGLWRLLVGHLELVAWWMPPVRWHRMW